MIPRFLRGAALAVAVAVLAGCATGAGPRSAADPLEPMNRAIFSFNETLDEVVAEPLARAYVDVVPEVVRFVAGNFFANLADLWTAGNQLLQGKPAEAASDLGRFTINSTLGFLGLADVASEIGLERHREDFGQTLGRWGVPTGPYLVLPVFGPSNLRDAGGFAVDMAGDPLRAVGTEGAQNNARVVRIVDTRAALLRAGRVVEGAALDKYSFVRDGYLQRRRNLVWDGDPPPEPEPSGDDPSDGRK